jgi:hypothetical protein
MILDFDHELHDLNGLEMQIRNQVGIAADVAGTAKEGHQDLNELLLDFC